MTTPGALRQPALKVLCAGQPLPGVVEASIESNSHYQADRWSASFALNAPGAQDETWWGADERVGQVFDVQFSLDGGASFTSFIQGEADRIRLDDFQATVHCEGRDLTRRFVDARTQESFQNQTLNEIAATLAARHGMTANAAADSTLVDRFYKDDHDKITHGQFSSVRTEWDLLTALAGHEGLDVYVTGTVLNIQPSTDPAKATPYTIYWDPVARKGDVTALTRERSLTLAKDITVIVRSWHSGKGKSFTRTSPQNGMGAVRTGKAQPVVIERPNLTEDQAQKLADSTREQITRHERLISFSCPLEMNLTARSMITLTGGCSSGWTAQNYYINTITRRMGPSDATQEVSCKNRSTDAEVLT